MLTAKQFLAGDNILDGHPSLGAVEECLYRGDQRREIAWMVSQGICLLVPKYS